MQYNLDAQPHAPCQGRAVGVPKRELLLSPGCYPGPDRSRPWLTSRLERAGTEMGVWGGAQGSRSQMEATPPPPQPCCVSQRKETLACW